MSLTRSLSWGTSILILRYDFEEFFFIFLYFFLCRLAKSSSGVIVSIQRDMKLIGIMGYTAFLDMISTMLHLGCVTNSTGYFFNFFIL